MQCSFSPLLASLRRTQQGNDTKYLQAAACLKHFAAYSQETGREGFAATVSSQDMEDTYLPAFSVGIESGKAEGLMCSYNAETYGTGVHGNSTPVPSCANSYLLTDLAREKASKTPPALSNYHRRRLRHSR